jgi:hypothetical protein
VDELDDVLAVKGYVKDYAMKFDTFRKTSSSVSNTRMKKRFDGDGNSCPRRIHRVRCGAYCAIKLLDRISGLNTEVLV